MHLCSQFVKGTEHAGAVNQKIKGNNLFVGD